VVRLEAEFCTALERFPGDPELLLNDGQFSLELNRCEETGRCFSRVVAANSGSVDTWLSPGLVAFGQGEAAQVWQHFRKAICLDLRPSSPETECGNRFDAT